MAKREFPVEVKAGSISVKIYLTPAGGRNAFTLSWHQGRRRERRMFRDFAKAKQEAQRIARTLASGLHTDTLTLRSEDRAAYLRATSLLSEIGTPLEFAAAEYVEAQRALGNHGSLMEAVKFYLKSNPASRPVKTVEEVFTEMIAAKEADGLSPVYTKNLRTLCGRFARLFRCPISSVTVSDINNWLRQLKGRGGRGRNNYRLSIVTLLRFAVSAGYLAKDALDFDHIAKAKEPEHRIEIFSPEEIRKLLHAAQADAADSGVQGLVPVLLLGGFAGLRTAEAQRQKWTDIHLERGFIRVTAAKGNTAQKRLVPIKENLRAWLAPFSRREGPCCDLDNVADALLRVAKKAGVEWKRNGLRHSYISYRVAECGDIPRTAFECGNSPAMIHRHYRELVTPEEAKAWFSVFPATAENVVAMAAG